MIMKKNILLMAFFSFFLIANVLAWYSEDYDKQTNATITTQDDQVYKYDDYPFNISWDTQTQVLEGDLDPNCTILVVVNQSNSSIPYLLLAPNDTDSRIWINFTNSTPPPEDVTFAYDNNTVVSTAYVPNITEFNNMHGTTFDKDFIGTCVNNLPYWSETDPCTHLVNGTWGAWGSADGDHCIFMTEASDDDILFTPSYMADVGKIQFHLQGEFYIYKLLDVGDNPAFQFYFDADGDLDYGVGTSLRMNSTEVTLWEIMYDTNSDIFNLSIVFENGTGALSVSGIPYMGASGTPTYMKWWTAGAPNVGDYNYGSDYSIDNVIVRENAFYRDPHSSIGSESERPTTTTTTTITTTTILPSPFLLCEDEDIWVHGWVDELKRVYAYWST